MKHLVAYTAVFGKPDVLLEPAYAAWRVPLLCFTDLQFKGHSMWKMVQVNLSHLTPARRNRKVKLFWESLLDGYEYSLYLDSTVELLVDPIQLLPFLEPNSDIAVFRHPERDCLYEEAREVKRLRKAEPWEVDRQVAKYRGEGFPPHAGLFACTVILRRHSKVMRDFCRAWWEEVEAMSARDQVSFPYLVRRYGIKVSTFPGSLLANEFISWRPWERKELGYIQNWEVPK